MARVKISVIKRLDPKLVFGEQVPINPATGKAYEVCPKYLEGQEFVVEEDGKMPDGFCAWAWNDLYKDWSVLRFGGNFPWSEEGEIVTCCTDGIRPVSFKLVRM